MEQKYIYYLFEDEENVDIKWIKIIKDNGKSYMDCMGKAWEIAEKIFERPHYITLVNHPNEIEIYEE